MFLDVSPLQNYNNLWDVRAVWVVPVFAIL